MAKTYSAEIYLKTLFQLAIIALSLLTRKNTYCKSDMKKIDDGGQSNIYECEGDLIKIYKNSWKSNMKQIQLILEGLELGIVIFYKEAKLTV